MALGMLTAGPLVRSYGAPAHQLRLVQRWHQQVILHTSGSTMLRTFVRPRPSWPGISVRSATQRLPAEVTSPRSAAVVVRCQPFHSTTPSSIGFTNFKSSPKPKWKVCAILVCRCFSVPFVYQVTSQVSAGRDSGIPAVCRSCYGGDADNSAIAVLPFLSFYLMGNENAVYMHAQSCRVAVSSLTTGGNALTSVETTSVTRE